MSSHTMEDSVSKISNTEHIAIQIGDEVVRIFRSLDLGGDFHPSVHNSDITAIGGERSKNTTTLNASDETQSFLNDSSDRRTNCFHGWSTKTDHDDKGVSFLYNPPVLDAMEQSELNCYSTKFEEGNISKAENLGVKNLGARMSYGIGRINDHQKSSSETDRVITNEDNESPLSCNDPILIMPREKSEFCIYPFKGIDISKLPPGNGFHTFDASRFRNLQIESHGDTQFRANFLEMMVDRKKSSLFEELLDECNDEQLHFIIEEIMWNPKSFMSAASSKEGATSMLKLIRRIKKTIHAYTLTGLLSPILYDLMTHYRARRIVKQCLDHFGSKPNEILYEQAIVYHQRLAIHEVGCLSLNECIDTISGTQKMRLLDNIAETAVFLSNDPCGNYVVQYVMNLGHALFTTKIMSCLQGHFARLSHTKGGSHVVESCINSSEFGAHVVVAEFLRTPLTPFNLARHQYGNYVIQTALRNLKIRRNMTLYFSLVEALEPYCSELKYSAGGKQVINLIKDDIGINH